MLFSAISIIFPSDNKNLLGDRYGELRVGEVRTCQRRRFYEVKSC
jgi:hypothetical protein